MNRRSSLIALVSLAAIAAGAVLVATRADPSKISALGTIKSADDLPVLSKDPVPDLAAEGWINSDPLTAADLKGKVVIYDFWTYSCVNCVRTLPHIKAWYDRYRDDGLVVVGVHSPEFDFEKDHANVERAVKELHVTWPVALDDDMAIWSSFGNQYWPAKYVTDRRGRIRYFHPGEGSYDETEDVLRALLAVDRSSPRAGDEDTADPLPPVKQTPETYLGSLRGSTSTAQERVDGANDLTAATTPPDDTFALDGRWTVAPEFVEQLEPGASIVLRYRGGEVNLVMEAVSGPVDVAIEIDGKPVEAAARGDGVTEAGPDTVTRVSAADLYSLVRGGPEGTHTLRLTADGAGLRAYAFTFGT